MKLLGVIPARYASTRFPGKPLHPIAGRPLLERVVERCRLARCLSDVIVATDDERIAEVARRFARVEMTRTEHPSGTDRIAEVAARLPADGYVNVQGDEPLMDPAVVDAVGALLATAEMSTAATPITQVAEYSSPNVVKAVVGSQGLALYFSRRPLPYLRDLAEAGAEVQCAAFP
ncbi:MAG: NTP transferase domain-containing protein, partial [Verrucomicrobia bacterium]|nr:NTP transferase domain-containing protein [Verrucomicrobiota bacterium]